MVTNQSTKITKFFHFKQFTIYCLKRHNIVSGDQRPVSKDLNRFLTDYWRATGLQLGLKSSVLDQVEADHHTLNERFRVTLDKWLQLNVGVTWANLELAITNANRESLGLQPLATGKENIIKILLIPMCGRINWGITKTSLGDTIGHLFLRAIY